MSEARIEFESVGAAWMEIVRLVNVVKAGLGDGGEEARAKAIGHHYGWSDNVEKMLAAAKAVTDLKEQAQREERRQLEEENAKLRAEQKAKLGLFILPETQPEVVDPKADQPTVDAKAEQSAAADVDAAKAEAAEPKGDFGRARFEACMKAKAAEEAKTRAMAAELGLLKAKPEPEPVDEPEPEEEEEEEEPIDDEINEVEARVGSALVPWVQDHSVLLVVNLPVATNGALAVEQLNTKHAVIGSYGGKCAVLSWELGRGRYVAPVFQSFTDFRNRYMNRYVRVETEDDVKRIAAGKYWLSASGRRTYDAVVFDPSEGPEVWGNRLNLWRGFALLPQKGCWKRLRNHIYRVLANGDRKAGRYIVKWIAWTLQNPGKPAEVVLVFRGGEGAGKGTLARALLKIFGSAGLPISDVKHLTGGFSGHLHHCVFLFLDEAFWAGNFSAEGRLKALITEEEFMIEPKYFQAFPVTNLLHIMIASNSDWVVPANHQARRYMVNNVADDRIGDFRYFNELNEELAQGGIEAMMYDLLQLELGNWHPKQIYKTAALMEQKQHSLRGLDAWIEGMLQRGSLPVPRSAKYPNRCLSKDLEDEAKEYDKFTNSSRMVKKLKDMFDVEEFNTQTARGWAFPSLLECRQTWEARNGGQWEWHHDVKEWQHHDVDWEEMIIED
jgi:hypothetical protein